MKIFLIAIVAIVIGFSFEACKSSSGPKLFCDTTCIKDSMKFTNETHPLKPYLYISARNCNADTLVWSYSGMGTNRKSGLADMLNTEVRLNKHYVKCFIPDTSYAWLMFNDCSNGRGYLLKLPFNKTNTISRKSSAINSIDPKFSVAEGLAAYTDRGNIFVEEMASGKKAMMTFGKIVDIDYDAIHEYIDSVNVSPGRIWVKIKIDNEWTTLEKDITLQ
ncbi:MAG TPA: hypothetical protein VET23_13125 [Chitinophagaceae bacterium]|nr:hypothetical protein [Chitinophagaceae bacterium]